MTDSNNAETDEELEEERLAGQKMAVGRLVQSIQFQMRSLGKPLGAVSPAAILQLVDSGDIPESKTVEALRGLLTKFKRQNEQVQKMRFSQGPKNVEGSSPTAKAPQGVSGCPNSGQELATSLAEMKSHTLAKAVHKILISSPGQTGSYEENVLLTSGIAKHRFSLATGFRWNLAQGEYRAAFGEVPGWLLIFHPAQRADVCELAVKLQIPLPPMAPPETDVDVAHTSKMSPPTAKSNNRAAPSPTRARVGIKRDALSAAVHDAIVKACHLECNKSAFVLLGRGHEARVTLDRKLASVLRGAAIEKVTIAGYGANNYYPLRAFKRAAASLRRSLGWSPIAFSFNSGQAYWVELRSDMPAGDTRDTA